MCVCLCIVSPHKTDSSETHPQYIQIRTSIHIKENCSEIPWLILPSKVA